jgi:hypothetical protein
MPPKREKYRHFKGWASSSYYQVKLFLGATSSGVFLPSWCNSDTLLQDRACREVPFSSVEYSVCLSTLA